jgi:hypothetical protein
MATGPWHYEEAERLLELAEHGADRKIDPHRAIRAASVHATLALAAATALQAPGGDNAGMVIADASEWEQACSAAPFGVEVSA